MQRPLLSRVSSTEPRASFLSFSLALPRTFQLLLFPVLFFLFAPRLELNRTPISYVSGNVFFLHHSPRAICVTAQTSHELDDTRMTLNLTDINKRRRFHRPFRPSKKTEKAVIGGERERKSRTHWYRALVKRLANGEQTLRNTLPPLPLNFLVNAFLTSV